MSLYIKEKPEYFRQCMESLLHQTVLPDEIVIVKDGPVTEEMDAVLAEYVAAHKTLFKIVPLETNRGLGLALAEGLQHCTHEIVARMDTDDIAVPNRFELQLAELDRWPAIDICGGHIIEFDEDPSEPIAERKVPLTYEEIVRYQKKRSAFNHMTVMFRKSKVLEAGNYQDCPLMEDDLLWVELIRFGARCRNVDEYLCNVRTNADMIARRGGLKYFGKYRRARKRIYKTGFISFWQYLQTNFIQFLVCIMPGWLRKKVFFGLLHKSKGKAEEAPSQKHKAAKAAPLQEHKEKKVSRVKYVRFKDILACFVFLFMLPVALVAKIFIHDFWLVGEEKNEARDNGYWFFKYVREHHPEQKIAYVINKQSADFANVKDLGKIIQWGGISHWFWYLVAKKNISSQKGCKPNAAACYLFEVKLRLWRNKRYFLQHGVTKDDMDWLYYDKCYFKLFCCSAKPEYEYILAKFGYPKGVVEYVGFTRFDGLFEACETKKQILVMPTWREYLVRPHGNVTEEVLKEQFPQTEYFKKWAELLCSKKLQNMLAKEGYTLLFYPHRNMQCYLDEFNKLRTGKNVRIAVPQELSVQQALKESALLITDYSSVFFDFAYMKKPVLFYQFDEKEFRDNQYKQGYLDYHNNSLGVWMDDLGTCLNSLSKQLKANCPGNDNVKEFFELYDNKNCERTYEAVLSH